jgi:hypothetical protein
MTYPHLPEAGSGDRPASGGQVRQRLAYVRQQEQLLTGLRGFPARGGGADLCATAARDPPATPGHAPATACPVWVSLSSYK